ncbi:MAG: sigma-70 family RNA polymerase sigma factor [Chloroflexi bacterium]|nr:sigma-70 family RNA polymerase sigma factor [Chloroflexota bacterium]
MSIEEDALIAASRKGELQAFNSLVLRYQGIVYNLAYRMLNDGETAADVAQDTFMSALKGINGFRGGSFKAWILRITSNACYDRLRQRQRHPTSSLDALVDDVESPTEFADPDAGPEEIALRRELMAHIRDGLLCLPAEQRLAVVLSDVQGLSYEEIAQVANCSLGTVKSRLARGRARMRDHLMRRGELLPSRYRHDVEG